MACKIYNLKVVGPSFPSTYSFLDCSGNTVTLLGLSIGDDFYLNADDSTPPPIVDGILIDDPGLGFSSSQYDVVDCCNEFAGKFSFLPALSPIIVFGSTEVYYSDGSVYNFDGVKCLSYGDEVVYSSTTETISAIKINDYSSFSCEECLVEYPCPTPTPTPTPQPTPKVFDFVNECNVITLFPMGVECSVIHPSPEGSDGIASLIITGGTPPYTILWDNGNISPIIYNLTAGSYESVVTDFYGDFTIRTVCTLTGSTPTPSPTPTPTPTIPYIEYDLCMETNILMGEVYTITQTSFFPDDLFNSRPSWTSGDSTKKIVWDISVSPNRWILSSSTPTTYTIINQNPIYPPIYGGWTILGGGSLSSVIVFSGECGGGSLEFDEEKNPELPGLLTFSKIMSEEEFIEETLSPLTMNVSKNETLCGCDGAISIIASGGNPPYQYSINSGITYKKFPIFNDLCSGIYQINVIDSNDILISTSVTLLQPQPPLTYTVSLKTTNNTTNIGSLSKTIQYDTIIEVSPELPDNVFIQFDLNHINISNSSPNENSSSSESNTVLTINSEIIEPSNENESSSTTTNTLNGCELDTVFLKTISESWSSVIFDKNTDFKLTTITKIDKNEDNNCYIGTSDDSYQLTNISINGCDCCNIIIS